MSFLSLRYLIQFFVLFKSTFGIFSESVPFTCKYNVSVDITDGFKYDDGTDIIIKDNINYVPRYYYRLDDRIYGCVCNVKICIRKCCQINMINLDNSCVVSNDTLRIRTYRKEDFIEEKTIDIDNYYLLNTKFCPQQKYLLDPDNFYDQFLIQTDGKLYLKNVDDTTNYVLPIDYCIDTFKRNNKTRLNAKLCGTLSTDEAAKVLYSTGKSFSFSLRPENSFKS